MEDYLNVKTADGKDWQIYVLDFFKVDEYPDKEYVAYTFGEPEAYDTTKSYISVLCENDNYFTLEAMSSFKESEDVKKAYENMLLEGGA